ncbi:MAG: phosphodiester glycosidase family protein [Pseudomonadota bacterium]
MPLRTQEVVQSLMQGSWMRLEEGLDVLRSITQDGVVVTSYRISPERFTFSIVLQDRSNGSRVETIGEREGAVLAFNGGFFAQTEDGSLYSIGYLKLNGEVKSKGWREAGGLILFNDTGLELLPTHSGIPQSSNDIMQTRPMILEPGGKWAMGSNLGEIKHRTLLCKMKSGEVIFVLVTRSGMSLYEAGWMLREKELGGFFGCDSAVALDGGRSTQVWYSGRPEYSYSGLSTVQNFIVVRQNEN